MKKILLIDVSNLFFRAFYAVPSHFTMKNGLPSNAIYGVASVVFSLLDSLKPNMVFAARDLKGGTFRHDEIEGYKAGRPDMPEELSVQLPYVFELFTEALDLPMLSKETFEADDVIATVAERFRNAEDTEVYILSADQDLLQLVGDNVYVLYPQNGTKPPKKMDAEAVVEKMGIPPEKVADYKGIAGDSSDKLVGVPGIGPVGAKKILEQFGTLENAIEHADEIPGKNGTLLKEHAQNALLTKRLATLHRDLDIPEYCENKATVSPEMPKNLVPFLEEISSRNLITRAEKIFGAAPHRESKWGCFEAVNKKQFGVYGKYSSAGRGVRSGGW
jgi:DNA polymerase-1